MLEYDMYYLAKISAARELSEYSDFSLASEILRRHGISIENMTQDEITEFFTQVIEFKGGL